MRKVASPCELDNEPTQSCETRIFDVAGRHENEEHKIPYLLAHTFD
jgi:hypothetical protein